MMTVREAKAYKLCPAPLAMEEDAKSAGVQKVGQEQIHGLLFSDQLSWQAILYDLINTEQLNPWDINLSLLAQRFLEKVRTLEEANFFISSKVLLAAALLLRMKSEILLEQDVRALDEILYGRKEEKPQHHQERLELDEEIPELLVRTPLPRTKKVTLEELMQSLNQAIQTENRRIKRIVVAKQQAWEAAQILPRQRINIPQRIRQLHARLESIFRTRDAKLAFSELAGSSPEERIATFIPLLHLDTQHKVWLEQEGHCAEIWILLKHLYEQQHAEMLEAMRKEVEAELEKLQREETLEAPDESAGDTEDEKEIQERTRKAARIRSLNAPVDEEE